MNRDTVIRYMVFCGRNWKLLWLCTCIFIFISIVVFDVFEGYMARFDGIVILYQAETRNHSLPAVTLVSNNGDVVTLSGVSFVFRNLDLKVGDQFSKERFSKSCLLNEEVVECAW